MMASLPLGDAASFAKPWRRQNSSTARGESMSATEWKATIRLPNGNQQEVRVMADSQFNARQMIEAQYGRGKILFGVHKVDLTRW
jgi:hypothetical protein